jgi:hypothetical protein
LASFLKKILFWNYERTSWQWDVLCVLILIFIFMTPKAWFTNSERQRAGLHQRPSSSLLLGPEVVENEADRTKIQHHVRTLTGRPDAEVLDVRKVFDKDGKPRGYVVDIR